MWDNNRGRRHQSCGCQPWNEGPWRYEEPWKDCPSCNWQRGSWENRHGPWTTGPLGRRAPPQFGPFWQRPSGPCPRCSHEYYTEPSRCCDECQERRDCCAHKRPGFAGPWHQDLKQQECEKLDRKNFTPAILFGLLWWVLFKRSNNSWEDKERTETPGDSRHRGEYVHH